jgi:glycerol uptake facilitator protein
MNYFFGEFLGTALLILLGNGVVANVLLNKSKGENSGWIVITMGWSMAVFVGVYTSAAASGAHINPAVTLAFAWVGKITWDLVPAYIAAQVLGAMAGQLFVWIAYRPHYAATENADLKMATFCTSPAIRSPFNNLFTEIIGTFVLILGVLLIASPQSSLGALDALPVALLVLGIGLSLGGPTGYAINPARDLGPRIMHFLLPMKNKRDSDWSYSWVPIIGPFTGAIIAALVFELF